MTLLCSISGLTPEDPIVSQEGVIFEKAELDKWLSGTDTCPITGQLINERLLTSVENPPRFVHPCGKASHLQTVPGMLELFRADMDRIMLRNLSLRGDVRAVLAEIAHIKTSREAGELLIRNLKAEIEEARNKCVTLAGEIAHIGKKLDSVHS